MRKTNYIVFIAVCFHIFGALCKARNSPMSMNFETQWWKAVIIIFRTYQDFAIEIDTYLDITYSIFNYFLTKGQEKIGYHYTLENNSPPLYLMCLPGSWCLKSLEMPKLSKKLLFFKNEDNLRALVIWKFAKIREVVNYRQSFKNCFEMNMWFHSEKLNFCAIL